jgi:DNA invertase Pin-like site-specific DNA recombinase
MAKAMRAALYLRVSTDGQTVENQRIALRVAAERRGWTVTAEYADEGISGAKGRDQRPGLDKLLRDASKGRFDVAMVWSIDRLGRSAATVTAALEELPRVGATVYADREGMDGTTPHGRAMLQMAAVFGELERAMIHERIHAGLARARAEIAALPAGAARKNGKKMLGRPKVAGDVEDAIRAKLADGIGQVKIARELGVGTGTVQRVRKMMQAGFVTPI